MTAKPANNIMNAIQTWTLLEEPVSGRIPNFKAATETFPREPAAMLATEPVDFLPETASSATHENFPLGVDGIEYAPTEFVVAVYTTSSSVPNWPSIPTQVHETFAFFGFTDEDDTTVPDIVVLPTAAKSAFASPSDITVTGTFQSALPFESQNFVSPTEADSFAVTV